MEKEISVRVNPYEVFDNMRDRIFYKIKNKAK